jgi:hypothetical protein
MGVNFSEKKFFGGIRKTFTELIVQLLNTFKIYI